MPKDGTVKMQNYKIFWIYLLQKHLCKLLEWLYNSSAQGKPS